MTEDNLALKQYRDPPYSKGPLLSRGAFKSRGDELIEEFDIRGVRPGLPVRLLSGGNLQKALEKDSVKEVVARIGEFKGGSSAAAKTAVGNVLAKMDVAPLDAGMAQ